MEQRKLTFEDVCKYAELCGCGHREDPSRAKDYTGKFFQHHWANKPIMVLYEGPKRAINGRKPEICWWVIDRHARLESLPARHIRNMDELKGIALSATGTQLIINTIQ